MGVKRTALDMYFSDAVRERDNWTCQRCGLVDVNGQMTGKSKSLDCSHVYTRKYQSLRTYPDNALTLCRSCHQKMGDRPPEHAQLVQKHLGEVRYQMLLERRANSLIKYTKADKKELLKHYKSEVKRLRDLRKTGSQVGIDLVSFD
jgi:hypothetical protein